MNVHDELSRLHTEMRACRRCLEAGYAITPGAIFSGGAAAQIMLIGQAPGGTEVVAQRPFNANSGRRLFQWLGAAGWDEATFRAAHYMTAVTKCYPGKSRSGKGDRLPGKAEQTLCRPFLQREIALIQPRLLLLVGGLAIKLLYPAATRLEDIIGTAVYFSPASLAHPVNFNLAQAERHATFDPTLDPNGRWVVPLPHPSGASLWPNRPENQARIEQAIRFLCDIRQRWFL